MNIRCDNCTHHKKRMNQLPCRNCFGTEHWEPMTNAQRIRAMTDEELAVRLCGTCPNLDAPCPEKEDGEPDCKRCWLDWLKQPCGGADHE